jgi:GcrA cell cycle regulator
VIGKVHRLGLSNRAPGAGEAEAGEPVAEIPPVPEQVHAPPPPPEPDPEPEVAFDPAPVAPQVFMPRKLPVPAGMPLPPQPSANEISPETLASAREVEKRARRLTLMELTERTCKWPIGDPATDDFWFCGLPASPGKPYCEAHVGVAFQPMTSKRDRRR